MNVKTGTPMAFNATLGGCPTLGKWMQGQYAAIGRWLAGERPGRRGIVV